MPPGPATRDGMPSSRSRSFDPVGGRTGLVDVGGASVLDQTADRDGIDVAGRWKGPRQGETDVHQR
ncbi:hypothetical protein SaccyDRAFT_2626 [Saccharomonospora cyanea NA-134]|uniref:Uncharacterized protein n=1 Tax=Saccharomonospora cyanea NA-134 TaxID=882082 RepID=H5XF75_9PSEU|nr:hypothetical protein SaccyDRAFT_2626 [Saccharomonospora cyanea NA-134]